LVLSVKVNELTAPINALAGSKPILSSSTTVTIKECPEAFMGTVRRHTTNLYDASDSEPDTLQSASLLRLPFGQRLPGSLRKVRKGGNVFEEGEKAEFYYRVVSGVVRTYMVLKDGRRIIDDFHFAGDILGFAPEADHRLSAATICDTVVVVLRRSDSEGTQDSRRQAHSSLVVALGRAQDHLVLLMLKTPRQRVEAFLGMITQRASRSGIANLGIPQSDIADYLGLSRETVSRTLTQLECDSQSMFSREA
jgi:CRP/FNR family nitrogen fixation transcriptional regulator